MKRAFTLIELLIVVAIIAILAAIAVPNFMEAQTRSKVARAVSDMRTITTALESYAVDHKKYPFDWDSRGWPWYLTDVITTPVAYLTSGSTLEDPFREGGGGAATPVGRRFRYLNYPANIGPTPWKPSPIPGPYTTRWDLTSGTPAATVGAAMDLFGSWKLSSAGPDKDANASYFGAELVYDASNGTISEGDIIRSQKKTAH
jgi:prepilin-type N-terminal cleavage/methylation domain-containing protein